MFRKRFRRRRRFTGSKFKRKEPVWIQTAFEVAKAPLLTNQDLFALVGPEDYTPDYLSEPQRLERSVLVRTVGQFVMRPIIEGSPTPTTQRFALVRYKAALFIAGDKQIDDGFAADPAQFDIAFTPETFVSFCRDYKPLKVFWHKQFTWSRDAGADFGDYWVPPTVSGYEEWDVTVKRRMQGDEGLWLLINSAFINTEELEFGGGIEVESRNLLND